MAVRKSKKPSKSNGQPKLAVEALLACDAVAADPGSGKATIYGIFDVFFPDKIPATVGFFVYAKFIGEGGPHPVAVDIIDEDDKSILEETPKAEIQVSEEKKAVLIVRFEGLKIVKAGRFRLVIRFHQKLLGEYHLGAKVKKKKK